MEAGSASNCMEGGNVESTPSTTKTVETNLRKRKSERIIKTKLAKKIGGINDEGNSSTNAVNLD